MAIEYLWYFFHLIRPASVREKFQAALQSPETLYAVGVEDPQLLVEFLRDNASDIDVRVAAAKLFPYPRQGATEFFQFNFVQPTIVNPVSGAIVNLGLPAHNMINEAGAVTWVQTYRDMVHDWCAKHREDRLSPNAADAAAATDAPSS
ncbi:hypothetical protein MD484_g7405, partial [Candolleomyces efflorescens]